MRKWSVKLSLEKHPVFPGKIGIFDFSFIKVRWLRKQFHFLSSEGQAEAKESSVRESYSSHSLYYNHSISRTSLSQVPKSMRLQRQHPWALSNITFVIMLYWLDVTKCLLKLSSLVNSYDTHSSKITLLLVLISWWQISIFGFYISFSRTCRGGQHHSDIPVACNLTFSKTLTVLWLTEILCLQQRYTCRPL